MNKKFVKTKNVKEFVGFMEELKSLPPNIPKIALVYGDYGLGKSETIKWWTFKNDCVYVRATKGMSVRWLLSEISEELGEEPYWHSQETFNMIENKLRQNPKTIIIDEVDYLISRCKIVETLRDVHDLTGAPVVLIGMQEAKTKLGKYRHLYDRLSEIIEFKPFSKEDMEVIVEELSEIKITDEAKEIFFEKTNRFRQIIKGISLLENLAATNGLNKIDVKQVKGLKIGQ